jgi:hypothetical protein
MALVDFQVAVQEYFLKMLEEQPYKAYVLLFAFTVYVWETYLRQDHLVMMAYT